MLDQTQKLQELADYGREHAQVADPAAVRRRGDRRRRRRRGAAGIAATGLVAVVVAAAAGWIGDPGTSSSGLPATQPTSSRPAPTQFTPITGTLGPDGYGALALGMTTREAKATGEVELNPRNGVGNDIDPFGGADCRSFNLVNHPPAPDRESGAISPELGVALIDGDGLETPEGIHAGSKLHEVRTTYPGTYQGRDSYSWYAPVPGHPDSRYHFFTYSDGTVYQLSLVDERQNCVDLG